MGKTTEFDHVVLGGGTVGAVVAARLVKESEASVCLVEAGPSDENDWRVLELWNWVDLLGTELGYDYVVPLWYERLRHQHRPARLPDRQAGILPDPERDRREERGRRAAALPGPCGLASDWLPLLHRPWGYHQAITERVNPCMVCMTIREKRAGLIRLEAEVPVTQEETT